VAKKEKTYEGSVPLVTFGAHHGRDHRGLHDRSGAIILIPTWLMSIGVVKESTRWSTAPSGGPSALVAADQRRGPHLGVVPRWRDRAFGAKPMSERVSRTAFLLYILFLQLASAHHLLADPGLSTGWKIVNTSYACTSRCWPR
jgi:cytochrome c oxidase subunit I